MLTFTPAPPPLQAEFPDAYWAALEQLSAGRQVPLPRPHPKFSVEDMARIAQQGPRFDDLVLPHAEALPPGEVDGSGVPAAVSAAMAYNYVPSSVVGDWRYEVEPNWQQMESMSLQELYHVSEDQSVR